MDLRNNFRLLPNKFKKIGIGIIVVFILASIVVKVYFKNELSKETSEYVRDMLLNGIIFGIFVIVLSREKIEDEMVRDFRYRSMASVLIIGVVYTIVDPLIKFFVFKSEYSVLSAQQLLMFMLLMYLFIFSVIRYKKKIEE